MEHLQHVLPQYQEDSMDMLQISQPFIHPFIDGTAGNRVHPGGQQICKALNVFQPVNRGNNSGRIILDGYVYVLLSAIHVSGIRQQKNPVGLAPMGVSCNKADLLYH